MPASDLPSLSAASAKPAADEAYEKGTRSYWLQTGLNIAGHRLSGTTFSGTFLNYESTTPHDLTNTTVTTRRLKQKYARKSPLDQKRLGPQIPIEFLQRTRELAPHDKLMLTKPSQYHHAKLAHTHVLTAKDMAESDLKYCPTTVQQGEGKSYSYLRSLKREPSTAASDGRDGAEVFWGANGKGITGSQYPRKALIQNTFWSKSIGNSLN